jgi:Fur family ferric uptake transcriptional regulator
MKKSPAVTTESLKSTIRGAGLRSTSPRLVVLRRLFEATTPVSHSELFEGLSAEGLDRTTVYRNLLDLTEVGLVERTDLGDHVWRFELKRIRPGTGLSGHVHFFCTGCGIVSCLDEVEVKVKPGKGAPRAVTRQKVEVQLRGLCDQCE